MKSKSMRLLSLLLVLSMLVGLFATTAVAAPAASNAEVYDIRVDDLTAPVGIDNPNPVFSWKMKSDTIGAAQTAYAITVTSASGDIMWNTGWQESSDSIGIQYAGKTLMASTEYTVDLSVKDQGNTVLTAQSTFETGLMGGQDDLQWISLNNTQSEISHTTTYTIDFDFTIDSDNQGFIFGMQNTQNYVMWQLNGFKNKNSDKAVLLRPHFRVNGSWKTGSDIDVTEAIGYNSHDIIGQTIHERIVVDGTEIKLYFGSDVNQLKLANVYTHSEEIPLYNIGFRQNTSSTGGTEIARYDNIVITDGVDGTGTILYVQDFSGDYTLESKGAFEVRDGVLVGGTTTAGENVGMLKPNAFNYISATTEYTIDFDFIIDSYSQGLAFGMKDTSNFVMWQVNGWYNRNGTKAVSLRPHFKANGSWTGYPGHGSNNIAQTDVTEAIGGTIDAITGEKIHERIEVNGGNVKTYFGTDADNLTLASEYVFADPIPLYQIGFRQNTSSTGGTEICRFDNLVVTNSNGCVIYREDFEENVTLSGSENWSVEEGMLRAGSAENGENVSIIQPSQVSANGGNSKNLPAFRKSFTPKKTLKSAKLYTSGLGVYESYINGQRVGRLLDDGTVEYHELKPGFTEMGVRKFYSTYDVTWMLADGENVLSAVVSGGWWSGAVGNHYGDEDGYLAELLLTYEDGSTETIVTDTSWKAAKQSPIQEGTGIFEGERYDATVSTDWMLPGYNDSEWSNTKINQEFDGELVAWSGEYITVRKDLELSPQQLYVYKDITGQASGYYGTVVVERTYKDGEEITLNPGETLVVDFGQNFAGWEAFDVKAEAGTGIHVEHGEMLNDGNGATSRNCDGPEGSVYNGNYRVATADTLYTASGKGVESYHPSHTYYGFRYAAFTADKTVTLNNIHGQVVTSVKEDTAWMTTSDQDVNQLLSNVRWGMYSNYLSIPTDCPQRSERMGWTGDAQNFVEAGAYLGNNKSFLEKYLMDLRDTQRTSDGAYSGVAPTGSYGGASWGALGWADAGIIIPYYLYVVYGDTTTLAEHWDSMAFYMDSFMASTNGMGGNHSYGDHVSFESNDTEIKNMLGVSYYAWDAMLMSQMAQALGKSDEAEKYLAVYEAEKALYQSLYVLEDGSLKRDEQTPCLYALYLDLLPDEKSVNMVTEQLISNIERNGNKLQTGFLGTEIIMHTLTQIGRSDVAYKLLMQHNCPSWLYSVDQGATTMWESWNAYTLSSGLATSRNSYNHYSFGAVAAWMFRGMAGIGWDAEEPGFKHIVLAPQADQLLPEVNATFQSVYGPITSNMNYAGNIWNYSCSIPANTTGTIQLPVEKIDTLTANGKTDLNDVEGLNYAGYANGIATFEAVAGTYSFASEILVKQTLNLDVISDASVPLNGAEIRCNGELVASGLPATLTVEDGDVITASVTAKNDVDYAVTHWTMGGDTVSENAVLTYTVDGTATITAHVGYVGYENLAVGKAVTADHHNSDWNKDHLTDGILNNLGGNRGWSSSSRGTGSLTFSEYFTTIDLGEKQLFNRFQMYPRDFGVTELEGFPVAYTFYVSDDNQSWKSVYTTEDGALPGNLYVPTVVSLENTVEARYVRLGVTEVNKLDQGNRAFVQLSELGIYMVEPEIKDVTLLVTSEGEITIDEETVAYTISGKDMAGLATVTLTIALSDEYLAEPTAEAAEGWYVIAQVYKDGVLTVVVGNNAGANGEGDILTISAKPTGATGDATVTVTDAVLSGYDGEDDVFVNTVLDEATATTKVTYSIYDVNKDGIVDQLDLTRAQRWYGTDNATCDVNGDGEVNIADLILILNHYSE